MRVDEQISVGPVERVVQHGPMQRPQAHPRCGSLLPTCEVCGDGWSDLGGAPHFDAQDDLELYAKQVGWVITRCAANRPEAGCCP
jgi:hypothetical protein